MWLMMAGGAAAPALGLSLSLSLCMRQESASHDSARDECTRLFQPTCVGSLLMVVVVQAYAQRRQQQLLSIFCSLYFCSTFPAAAAEVGGTNCSTRESATVCVCVPERYPLSQVTFCSSHLGMRSSLSASSSSSLSSKSLSLVADRLHSSHRVALS